MQLTWIGVMQKLWWVTVTPKPLPTELKSIKCLKWRQSMWKTTLSHFLALIFLKLSEEAAKEHQKRWFFSS